MKNNNVHGFIPSSIKQQYSNYYYYDYDYDRIKTNLYDDTNNNLESNQKDIESTTSSTTTSSSCPFSMTFKRYRIPLSSGKDVTNNSNNNNNNNNNNIFLGIPVLSGIIQSSQKRNFERKFINNNEESIILLWYDVMDKINSSNDIINNTNNNDGSRANIININNIINNNKDKERIQKGIIGIHVTSFIWRTLSNLLQEVLVMSQQQQEDQDQEQKQLVSKSIIIGLPNTSLVGLQQIADIINWMNENETYYNNNNILSSLSMFKISICAKLEQDSPIPTLRLNVNCNVKSNDRRDDNSSDIDRNISLNKAIVVERTKAWVDRVLVKMKICPFTRSTTKSGQGLADVGVPVGNIAYHYSKATKCQFPMLMAGKKTNS